MSTSSCLLGFPNRIDSCTLTGGSWVSTLPLNNLKTRQLGEVARSSTAAISATTFSAEMSVERNVRVISLTNNNISLSGQVRIRASVEGTATNLWTRSGDFSNVAAWATGGATVTGNNMLAPDGNVAGARFDDTGASGTPSVPARDFVATSTSMSVSLFTKAGTALTKDFLLYNLTDSLSMSSTEGRLTYATGVVTNISTGLPMPEWTVEPFANGWYRLSISPTLIVGKTYRFYYGRAAAAPVGNTDTWYLWGAQLETGAIATSYYPTVASTAVRPAGYMDTWQSYAYDSGVIAAYPAVYNIESLEWEDDNFWTGSYTNEQIVGYTANYIHILETNILAKYWRVDISDTSNIDGYVQIGRVFIGPAWIPTYDAEIGMSMGWETNTSQQKALSGAKYYQRRTPYRVATFSFNVMDDDEAMSQAFEIDKLAGIDQEILYVYSMADTIHALRRRFLGTMRQLTPIEFPYSTIRKKAYTIEEIL